MADEADWSADSNHAVHISLVVPSAGGPRALHTFNPAMTYSVFGEDERIFGYQGLKINLRFNASDMRPGLQIQYTKRFKQIGETAPTDLKELLEPYLSKTAFEKTSAFDAAIAKTSSWTPPGELCNTIQSGDHTYEIWKGNLKDPAMQQMLKRIQILVPFYIDGGTFIDLSEPPLDRWTVFFLYEKRADVQPDVSPYVFIGYSTVYHYFCMLPGASDPTKKQPLSDIDDSNLLEDEDFDFSTLPCRSRISQFIILPPFQRGGHGSRLYNAIYDFYLPESQTIGLTVEDPNVAFDDMRDINDLKRLRGYPEFAALRINTAAKARSKGLVPRNIVDYDMLEKFRIKMKMPYRQFYRMVDLHLLSQTPKVIRKTDLTAEEEKKRSKLPDLRAKEHELHLWMLLVKMRVYKQNKNVLMQETWVDRVDHLERVVLGMKSDYNKMLDGTKDANPQETDAAETPYRNGKRSAPDDGTDESEDADEPIAKKAKKSKAA